MKKKLLLSACLLGLINVPVAFATSQEAGDFMVRVRAIGVIPDESSNIAPIGGKAEVSNAYVPEIDFTYFFTKNISAELIAATARHKVRAENTSVGNVDVGSAWLLPPTLTLQYHFNLPNKVKPYVGAGINYTFFYDEKPGALSNVDYKNHAAFAVQAGVDIPVYKDCYFINLDVKKIFLKTSAHFNDDAIIADVRLNPWVIGAGVGYRF